MWYIDPVNCAFEVLSSVMIWINVLQLWKDRCINGVHWGVAVFFTIESVWNLWYYLCLKQEFSFVAGISVMLGNGAWLWLARNYYKNKKFSKHKENYIADIPH